MEESSPVIKAEKLFKKYSGVTAVSGIDFQVNKNECIGLLGPNGAGKTTTVKMICCFSPVTSGRLEVMGMDVRHHPRAIKSRLGVIPQENNLDLDLTVEQNLLVYAGYFDIPRTAAREKSKELLDFFDLTGKAHVRADKLSGGMKRRLIIARALVNGPGIIILDEPTTGLDPGARHLVWEQLHRLKSKGITLLLTTHYLEEADRLCDRLLIMDGGNILEQGNPRELVKEYVGKEVLELRAPRSSLQQILPRVQGEIYGYLELGESLHLFPRNGQNLLATIQKENINLYHLFLRPAHLEDVFFKLTGKGLEE